MASNNINQMMQAPQVQRNLIEFARSHDEEFQPGFVAWLVDNAHIYLEFERQAIKVAAVRSHYAARTIVEVVRHNSMIAESSGPWKINNNKIPDLARLFALLNPKHSDLFSFRTQFDRYMRESNGRAAA